MNAAVAESTSAETIGMPSPLIFTDSAAAKVADLVAEEGNPDLEVAGLRAGRRLLGLPVRLHL